MRKIILFIILLIPSVAHSFNYNEYTLQSERRWLQNRIEMADSQIATMRKHLDTLTPNQREYYIYLLRHRDKLQKQLNRRLSNDPH